MEMEVKRFKSSNFVEILCIDPHPLTSILDDVSKMKDLIQEIPHPSM
jgi:hypothetical protein